MSAHFWITEYVSGKDLPEVHGIFKRLYSDFIVTEIPEAGRVLTPTTAEEELPKAAPVDEPSAKRPHLLSDDDLQKIEAVAGGEADKHSLDTTGVSKEDRKEVHAFIRSTYGEKLFSTGENSCILVQRTGKGMNDRKRQSWPSDRGDFLVFTLTKTNNDVQNALSLIGRTVRLNSSLFSVAGNKDRRAITTQRVSAYRVTKEKLQPLVTRPLRGIRISDLHYEQKKIQLGDLWGNRFNVIIRDIGGGDEVQTDLGARIEAWKQNGFINYFGPQRFGSCGGMNAEVGRLILAERWKEAVELLLQPTEEARGPLRACLEAFKRDGDAAAALKLLCPSAAQSRGQRYSRLEAMILSALVKSKNAYKAAVLALPRDSRSLHIHAYQSLVFNRVASKWVSTYGANGIKEGVSLPLPSTTAIYPNDEVRGWYEAIAEEDRVRPEAFDALGREFMIGDKLRPLLVKPSSVQWEILHYAVADAELQGSRFIGGGGGGGGRQMGEGVEAVVDGEKKPYRALQIQFDLPAGCYATVALREVLHADLSKANQKAKMDMDKGEEVAEEVEE